MRYLRLVVLFAISTLAFTQQGQKKLSKRASNEMSSAYRVWVEQDVAYIITDPKKQAFERLSNDDERDQFIEQFWLRRDPTPDTEENEFKEEHYRRIAYANEHYASGIPGWRTDRGMIYIKYGPPDEIEAHPSGGTYQRPLEQGGGTTTTYPFETWRYRYIEGIGTNIVVEFVDQSGTGEYRMSSDPQDKDALQHVPGYVAPNLQMGPNEFDRLKLVADLTRAPNIQFKDLEAVVRSDIRYNTLPIKVRTDYIPLTPSSILSNITIQLDRQDLQFQHAKAVVNLYARITTVSRRNVSIFEDVITVEGTSGPALYQKIVPLPSGRYRLTIAAKDVIGGNTATFETALDVPRFEEEKLAASSLILADLMETVATRNVNTGQFVIGGVKVRPRVTSVFSRDEDLGIYMQLYHLQDASIEYEITNSATGRPVIAYTEEIKTPVAQATVQRWLPLKDFAPGSYTLRLRVTDRDQSIFPTALFTVTR